MVKTIMHLFPSRTNKTECGVWGIMTNNIEDVTCPDCIEKYTQISSETKFPKDKTEERSSNPEEELDDRSTTSNSSNRNGSGLDFSGIDRINYAIGLSSRD